jgi:putative addiction module component (TIGR02574 family)
MTTADVIEQALSLKASDRYLLLEMLHHSLDKPDPEIDKVWQEEALRRVKAYDEGRLGAIPMEEVFKDL